MTLPPITLAETDPLSPPAIFCLTAYFGELKRRLGFTFDLEATLQDGAADLRPPGTFLVAFAGETPVGCAGLRVPEPHWGEVKRVWVAPEARGQRLAARMMDAIEKAARARALPLLRLDTNSGLPEALALYRRLGWTAIDRYNDSDEPDSFFEKRL